MKVFECITDELKEFITRQKMFFTGTAGESSRVNISPKGMDTFRVISPTTVAYLDHTGSGNETAAHLLENDRMTIMFCSFDKQAMILRLYGKGLSVYPSNADWGAFMPHFEETLGQRKIVVLEIDRVQTSCGFAVPRYEFIEERDVLYRWANMKGEDGLKEYRTNKNMSSIDGLPTGHVEPNT